MRRSLLLAGWFAASLLAACSSAPVATTAAPASVAAAPPVMPAPTPVPASRAPAPPPATATAPAAAAPAVPAHLDPASVLSRERSVFFDFDSTTLRPDASTVIQRHGQYLSSHPALKVVVEGNTDERGGREYNLALGQRRAEAVRSALKLMGAKDAQIEAVSLGMEKPVAMGHDEASWQKNRRADIVYRK